MTAREQNQQSLDQTAPVNKAPSGRGIDIDTIDLVELFYRLIEKLKWIIAASLIGALLAGILTVFVITPTYTATSKLYVVKSGEQAVNLSDLQIGSYLTADYMEVFQIWHVHEMVIEKLGLPYSYKQLSEMISVTNPSDTRILYITAKSSDPVEAKNIADTYAQVAKEFIAKAMDSEEPNIIEEALLPTRPSAPSKSRNIMLGFLLGFVLACGIFTLQFIVDDRIRNSEEISDYLGLTTLGVLPMQTGVSKKGNSAKQRK